MSRVPAAPNRVISVDQFVAILRKQCLTGVISISACVSIQGLDGEEDRMCTEIVRRVWEATGFRFTYEWFLLFHLRVNG